MCGLCGFVGRGDIGDLKRMNAELIHRGPDDTGLFHDENSGVFLGHRRLAIIDLKGGTQPMWTSNDLLGVVFNGEIYNHLELRKELVRAGHRFSTDHSDTEVLLHGYEEWGKGFLHKLNGMWAFALYDRRKNEIFLSRDRFGKKPLFYSLQNRTFAFASELTPLVRHGNITATLSPRSLKKYFAYGYIPAPSSIYRNIFKLPAGHNLFLQIPSLDFTIEKYWDFVLEPFDTIPKNPEAEWGEQIRGLLLGAVKRRLVSDVPLGVFLSGGMDSSSVAACAVTICGSEKVKSFSIGFEESSFDESEYSREIASFLGTDHNLEILSLEKAKSLLPQVSGKLDEPMGDNSLLPTYLLCRKTREKVTVALGGDGADELFAGYDPFRALNKASLYNRLVPNLLHKGIRMLVARLPVSHRNMSLDFRLKRTLRGLTYERRLWNPVWLGPLSPSELEGLFDEPLDIEDVYSEAIECWDSCKQENIIDKTLQFYTKLYLQDDILVKVDRAGMMNSLEVRTPYLDIDLVDLVRKIPGRFKCRRGETKYILKKALEPLLPRQIVYRSKKGFGVPAGMWFRKGLLGPGSDDPAFAFNPRFLRKRMEEHASGLMDHRAFLWNYWVLSRFRGNSSKSSGRSPGA